MRTYRLALLGFALCLASAQLALVTGAVQWIELQIEILREGRTTLTDKQLDGHRYTVTDLDRFQRTLYVDGWPQVSQASEAVYHEALVMPAMVLTSRPAQRVLVIGDQDGGALYQVLKFRSVRKVVLTGVPVSVLPLAHRHLSRIEGKAFSDPRVTVILDSREVLARYRRSFPRVSGGFDVIVVDPPLPYEGGFSKFLEGAQVDLFKRALNPGGIVAIRGWPLAWGDGFHRLHARLSSRFQTVIAAQETVPPFGVFGFLIASGSNLTHHRTREAILERLQKEDVRMDHYSETYHPAYFALDSETLEMLGSAVDGPEVQGTAGSHLTPPAELQWFPTGFDLRIREIGGALLGAWLMLLVFTGRTLLAGAVPVQRKEDS